MVSIVAGNPCCARSLSCQLFCLHCTYVRLMFCGSGWAHLNGCDGSPEGRLRRRRRVCGTSPASAEAEKEYYV